MKPRNRYNRMAGLVTALLALLTGAAGVAEEAGDAPDKTFGWQVENVHFYDAARFDNTGVQQEFENALKEGFAQKGMRFSDDAQTADLSLSYTIVLEDAASSAEVTAFRAANPELDALPEGPKKFENGILFIKLVNNMSGKKVWDTTYRGLAALDMPDDVRSVRLKELVTELLANYEP